MSAQRTFAGIDRARQGTQRKGQMDMNKENRTSKLLEMHEEEKKPFLTPERRKDIREWIVSIIVALIAFVIIRTFLFTMIRVDGESMIETLQDGDRLFVSILDVKIRGVENEDIVICRYPDEGSTYFVKRVIAQEGDTVEIRDGMTYVNGELRQEEYVDYKAQQNFGPYTVPEGQVFVMGDNRANSRDSRRVGALDEDLIVGKVQFIWWPFTRVGGVE